MTAARRMPLDHTVGLASWRSTETASREGGP